MKTQVSIKQILKDFIYLGKQLKVLFKSNEEYKLIIDFVLAKDYLDDDLDLPFPTLKEAEAFTGLKSHILRKLLLKMHSEIFNYDSKTNLSFKKIIYHFHITFFEHRCQFTVDYLAHVPKIGESIRLPFVSALIPLNYFYVDDIRHEFENDNQIVIIILKVGSYNEYYKFMKDKALELNKIQSWDMYSKSEDEIKKIIYAKDQYR
jgi:hypothetical protein